MILSKKSIVPLSLKAPKKVVMISAPIGMAERKFIFTWCVISALKALKCVKIFAT